MQRDARQQGRRAWAHQRLELLRLRRRALLADRPHVQAGHGSAIRRKGPAHHSCRGGSHAGRVCICTPVSSQRTHQATPQPEAVWENFGSKDLVRGTPNATPPHPTLMPGPLTDWLLQRHLPVAAVEQEARRGPALGAPGPAGSSRSSSSSQSGPIDLQAVALLVRGIAHGPHCYPQASPCPSPLE